MVCNLLQKSSAIPVLFQLGNTSRLTKHTSPIVSAIARPLFDRQATPSFSTSLHSYRMKHKRPKHRHIKPLTPPQPSAKKTSYFVSAFCIGIFAMTVGCYSIKRPLEVRDIFLFPKKQK